MADGELLILLSCLRLGPPPWRFLVTSSCTGYRGRTRIGLRLLGCCWCDSCLHELIDLLLKRKDFGVRRVECFLCWKLELEEFESLFPVGLWYRYKGTVSRGNSATKLTNVPSIPLTPAKRQGSLRVQHHCTTAHARFSPSPPCCYYFYWAQVLSCWRYGEFGILWFERLSFVVVAEIERWLAAKPIDPVSGKDASNLWMPVF